MNTMTTGSNSLTLTHGSLSVAGQLAYNAAKAIAPPGCEIFVAVDSDETFEFDVFPEFGEVTIKVTCVINEKLFSCRVSGTEYWAECPILGLTVNAVKHFERLALETAKRAYFAVLRNTPRLQAEITARNLAGGDSEVTEVDGLFIFEFFGCTASVNSEMRLRLWAEGAEEEGNCEIHSLLPSPSARNHFRRVAEKIASQAARHKKSA